MLGPVVRVRSGQTVKANVTNSLPVKSSVHWHGLFVPSAVDGPFKPDPSGSVLAPELKVEQPALPPGSIPIRTDRHGASDLHWVSQACSMSRTAAPEAFNLPRDYGVDDLRSSCRTGIFGPDGQLILRPLANGHDACSRGDVILVNVRSDLSPDLQQGSCVCGCSTAPTPATSG